MQVWRVPLRKVNQSYVIATSTRLTSLSGAIVGDNLPGKMIIGCNNVIGHHVVVGIKCQDMKYKDDIEYLSPFWIAINLSDALGLMLKNYIARPCIGGDKVMSYLDESGVTYTEISSTFEELSDIGSPGVIPSPDYIPGPEEPQSPPPLDYVLELIYPEYKPHEDEVFLAEEQPLPAAASPTAQSPDYVPESKPEADPEEDVDEDPEEDPVDYPADGGDNGDDEEGSSKDDEDDNIDIKADDDDEEEEHPAPADSVVVALPAMDQAPSAKETEQFETDESAATPPSHPAYHVIARISILAPVPTPVWFDAEVARLLAISTPPSSPLSPWSSPLPQIPSPPLPVSSLVLVLSPSPPASPIRSFGYRAAMIWLRAEDRPEVTLPPRKRLGIALGPTYEVEESLSAAAARPAGGLRADYGFVATMDREIRRDPEREVGYGIIDSWQATDEIYMRLDDEQSQRQLLAGRLNMLFRDRRAHAHTHFLMETEAKMSREAWVGSMRASDLARVKTQMAELQRQQGPAKGLAQPELPKEAGIIAALAARDANTNGVDNHNSGTGARRNERATRECTYPDFMKCQPLNFKGTERVVELTQWIEKMEIVFRISNYSVENQIKLSTCTLLGNALTWWNSHVRTVGNDIAYEMTWTELKKKITDKYCPRTEIKKLKVELWELKVKESDKIKIYVGGLPDMIHRSVVASKPKTMQEATEMAIEVMDKIIRTFADRTVEKKQNGGSKPLCSKCNYHHDGPCTPKCYKCNKVGHFARDCRSTTNANHQRGTGSVEGGNAPAKVYAIGHAGINPDSNVVTGTFLQNNRYASILFDIGADRSFVSTAFSSQIAITPTALDHYYDVELADGRIIGLNTILRGCTLNILNHPFNIDLMPVELGSFDVIIATGARLHIISYSKTQEYMQKGCPVFLAHVTIKEVEDKSEKKRLEDVTIVRDFPEVFPEDLSGLPPT
ncbi:putative reverse transcriptase domain-containing protein [Tanacetum coccineum]